VVAAHAALRPRRGLGLVGAGPLSGCWEPPPTSSRCSGSTRTASRWPRRQPMASAGLRLANAGRVDHDLGGRQGSRRPAALARSSQPQRVTAPQHHAVILPVPEQPSPSPARETTCRMRLGPRPHRAFHLAACVSTGLRADVRASGGYTRGYRRLVNRAVAHRRWPARR
jgi:hypothetical protein